VGTQETKTHGYPQFPPLSGGPKEDPATVLLGALSADDLEARVVETLPWLAITFHDRLDWDWLIDQARQRRTQNRLGFIASLGWRFAEKIASRRPHARYDTWTNLSRLFGSLTRTHYATRRCQTQSAGGYERGGRITRATGIFWRTISPNIWIMASDLPVSLGGCCAGTRENPCRRVEP
jgi:hypothetical protein